MEELCKRCRRCKKKLVVKHSFVKKGETASDRQKWKEELERYSRNKYQDEEISMKARKGVDEWEERSRRQRGGTGESKERRLTVSLIIQTELLSQVGKR